MKTIGSYEAKTHLSQLLDEVSRGETVEITKHGRPVARLVPPVGQERPDVGAVIDDWRAFRERERITLGDDLSIRDLIEEGRRY
jgi:prevent-host-death family protein